MLETKTRQRDGKTQYYCPVCGDWVKGKLWDGSGYTELICEDCGLTLDDDFFGLMELEQNPPADLTDPEL